MKLIGLGLDYQHFGSYTFDVRQEIERQRSRLSHLSIVALRNDRDLNDFLLTSRELPIIHHLSGVEPAGVRGVNLAVFARQDELSRRLNAAWCGEDIGIWSIGPYAIPYFAAPVFSREVLEQTIDGVSKIMERTSVTFAAEIPSCSFFAGEIAPGEFFRELCARTGCGLVLDLAHVFSFAAYLGLDPLECLRSFPLDHAIEFHVAGGSVAPNALYRYRDTHAEPVMDAVLEIFEAALLECRNLRGITYEVGVGLEASVLRADLNALERRACEAGFTPRLTRTPSTTFATYG